MKISIPSPCSENWDTMKPREKSRFCAACQKCVVDFTTASDAEIIQFLETKKENVCGRFNKSQLDRALIINKLNNRHRFGIAASLLFISTMSFSKSTLDFSKPLLTFNAFKNQSIGNKHEKNIVKNTYKLRGHIIDSTDNQPVIYAIIKIKGIENNVQTDIDGYFEMAISETNNNSTTIIEISDLGYQTKEIKLSSILEIEGLKIRLDQDGQLLGEVVITKHKKPILKRLYYFFKRLF